MMMSHPIRGAWIEMIEQDKSETEALKIIGERSRDNSRTPMQWSAEKYAGFSSVEPWIS